MTPDSLPPQDAPSWPSIGYGTLPLRRIVVVQTQRMGDLLCATPLFTVLRRHFPAARIEALVHRPHDCLLEANPDLDAVLAYDRQGEHRSLLARLRFIGELRERRYDWALVIHAASSVAFALWQAGIPWRTCVWRCGPRRRPHWARMYHQHIRQERDRGDRHEIEHNLAVLRELGMDTRGERYRLALRPEEQAAAGAWLRARGRDEGRRLAVIHPGHGGGRQTWAPERYAAVADGLSELGLQVAVTGSERERGLVESVAAACRRPVLPLAGGMHVRAFAAVLARASLFVSVSTGPMHLASAVGVPAVTLYGPTDLHIEGTRFCPYGSPARPVFSPAACPCAGSRTCRDPVCMAAIGPDIVLKAALELLDAA